MIEALLTLLCLIIPILYVKFQDGSINLDDFKQKPKQNHKPKQYLSDIDIPNSYRNQDFSRELYVNHLMSEKWRETKLKRLSIDNFSCKQFGIPVTAETSHCHHITYENLGDEGMKDIVTICPRCHNAIHEFHGKNACRYPLVDNSLLSLFNNM